MQFLENLPFDLNLLSQPVYVVGGTVRDWLLRRVRADLDLDLVVPSGAVAAARELASRYGAGFVLLDAERQIARVVFPGMTVDIAQMDGENIVQDLARRDFTLNAIAYDLQTGQTIDPLNGTQDIQAGMIRMVSKRNLIDDPLRLLRAYRQGAQLNLNIEADTRQAIRELAGLLTTVAAERVLMELRYLLPTLTSSRWLVDLVTDGVLTGWLNPGADLAQRLGAIDRSIDLIQVEYPQLAIELQQPLRNSIAISRGGMSKLMALLSPDLAIANTEMLRLTLSTVEMQVVATAITHLPQLLPGQMSLRQQYFWFLAVGSHLPILVVLALATGVDIDDLAAIIDRYLDPEDLVAHPTPLVSGNDLIKALQLTPSPIIGKLLTEIQIGRIMGQITTPTDAIEFARTCLES